MDPPQVYPPQRFALLSERQGCLPLINPFRQRSGLAARLDKFVPTLLDRRCTLSYAAALGVPLLSIGVEREPGSAFRCHAFRPRDAIHRIVRARGAQGR